MTKDYITRRQAADVAGVSTMTIGRWIKAGHLPAYHRGIPGGRGSVVVRRSDVERLLEPVPLAVVS